MTNDSKATVIGASAAATVLMTVDPAKLGGLDRAELGKVALAILLLAFGWIANREESRNADSPPLQAVSPDCLKNLK